MILIFPESSVTGAKRGLILWYRAALPSLFPFAVGISLLINLNFTAVISKLFALPAKVLFRLSPGGFFVFLSGILSGYPIGIKTLCEMYEKNYISMSEALRLSAFCSNSGPLFISGSLAAIMLKDTSLAAPIMICHYLSAIITGIVCGLKSKNEVLLSRQPSVRRASYADAFSQAVEKGCSAMIVLGGYIVLFSVITELLNTSGVLASSCRFIAHFAGNESLWRAIIPGILEMTNGCSLISALDTPLKLPLLCGLVSFGGLSVHAQSIGFMTKCRLSPMPYLKGKVISAILSFLLCLLFICLKKP